ncbi:unannotated protein [freshwater metagenome]|uniref:Unannotated protein n=1 Tax=freshwater metagenome TaxID=449393 RepID=A0A6J7KKF3_9ZZZZ|nr:glycosyltransferase [Actinomycetota bacterium]
MSARDVERLHVAGLGEISTPGGLNSVVLNLSAAQLSLGLASVVLDSPATRAKGELRLVGQGPASPPATMSDGWVAEYHFAQGFRALRRLLPPTERTVFHFHGPWFSEGRAMGQSRARVVGKWLTEVLTYRAMPVLTTHSAAFAVVLHESFRVSTDRIHLVYPGVDCIQFQPGPSESARQRLGLPAGARLVGSLRRLIPRMGLDLAIEAIASRPDDILVIAGDGPERVPLAGLAANIGVSDRVKFLGRLDQDQVPDFYRAMDIVVVPSRSLEGFGLVVLEAMACGTPVIAARCGGLPEALGPWADTMSFPVGDVLALASLLAESENSGPTRTEVRAHAESMSWSRTAAEMEAVIAHKYSV